MNLRLKRWITAGATLAMVATMGLSACSTNRALSSETERTRSPWPHAHRTGSSHLRQGLLRQGENGQFIQSLYRPLFRLQIHLRDPHKINP